MNNKAFTMIEVIAIIALLGVILIIALPKFYSSRDASRVQEKARLIEIIKNAGSQYFVNNNISVGGEVQITVLCAEDYIKCPMKDPVTNTNMNGTVKITNDANGILTYTYTE